MAVPGIILLGRLVVESLGESVSSLVSDCCSERLVLNGSCPADQRCSPGCFQIWTSNGGSSCIKCANDSSHEVAYNLTECTNITTQALEIHMNLSTTPSAPHHLSNPGIAASLLLGTFFISLFLVLSVASFFYLKRSLMLPEIFYRSNKASILQPSEMASMIPNPSYTGRKPRYVRRERSHKSPAPVLLTPSAHTQVSNV
ncbi:PREDICTED: uncharacterized protein C1orf159 homolog [Nanorana parkeri]|uniref:uncharacterized protein C1orf159 homolog n=1 Tax=Nanorana parkeri TaxID=125878 RepID=UPI00085419D2|nr:PREDICTED: uncharacterized protein C1orf159 homolog [Nanorana parkeri]